MRFRVRMTATLAICSVAAAIQQRATAQDGIRPAGTHRPAAATAYYYEPDFGGPAGPYYEPQRAVPRQVPVLRQGPRGPQTAVPRLAQVEREFALQQHPHSVSQPTEVLPDYDWTTDSPHGPALDGEYVEGPYMEGQLPLETGGECCEQGGYGAGCCESCGGFGSACTCWYLGGINLNLLDWCCPPGRYYVTADYLYVRASFSEAVSYLIHDDTEEPFNFVDEFHELEFGYESSYRVGGGYYMECCDEQVRFMFTRMTSSAVDFTNNPLAVGPFETSPGPGGTLDIRGDVDTKSWDLEYAKTMRLGGGDCCECGDPCACGSGQACGCGGCGNNCCPPWAITWSGGLRFAEVDWRRLYLSNNPQVPQTRNSLSTMEFEGGGPRVGLEGRRYFGQDGWGSVYIRGDISLLLGHVDLFEGRIVSGTSPSVPSIVFEQSANFRNIIPVTEIEAGLSAQVTCNSNLTAGYLFSAWHDLGFRDQFDFATFLETGYDDANILGFDGFFARLEWLF